MPYFEYTTADEASSRKQTGSRGQQFRRSHAISEHRNFMCCHIKRNDPASRRFCQYLSMQSGQILTLIRDVKTGQIFVKPPEEPENQNWLIRMKAGLGRASRNEWEVTSVRILAKHHLFCHYLAIEGTRLRVSRAFAACFTSTVYCNAT